MSNLVSLARLTTLQQLKAIYHTGALCLW